MQYNILVVITNNEIKKNLVFFYLKYVVCCRLLENAGTCKGSKKDRTRGRWSIVS